MNGAYQIGGLMLIKELESLKYFKVDRVSGCSVGAYVGFLYLIDKLDIFIDQYINMKEDFKKTTTMIKLKEQLINLINGISDEQFRSLQHKKLFVRYYNMRTLKPVVKSVFRTKTELVESILKSCHMPFLINGDLFYKKGKKLFLDGGMPFIFEPMDSSKKTIYMALARYGKIKSILNISHEKTIHGRVLEGLIDTYNFFFKKKCNRYVQLYRRVGNTRQFKV